MEAMSKNEASSLGTLNNGVVEDMTCQRLERPPLPMKRVSSSRARKSLKNPYISDGLLSFLKSNETSKAMRKPSSDGDHASTCSTLPTVSCSLSQSSSPTLADEADFYYPVVRRVPDLDESVAATRVQTIVRGALARWNLRVLKLQRKLEDIAALKEKQLKKLEQRQVQAKRALKEEFELNAEHRIIRRRLRRSKCLRNQFYAEKKAVVAENQQLERHCQLLAQQNDECAVMLQTYIEQMEIGQRNLIILKSNQKYLHDTCRTYEVILQEFNEATKLERSSSSC